jgi:pimeloyl-ACP methyl ester carboxylesterase
VTREDVSFVSDGDECRAWLWRGTGPLVIMGHGLGAVREMGLDRYAERFNAAGMGVLAFTYRHFGDSGGEPRQLLDIGRQLDDWAAALRYGRSLDGVDSDRVAIWGSSFGGGHVIEVAARDGAVAAVVSQCPFTDGLASMRVINPASAARGAVLAARDEIGGRLGRAPVMIALVGPPGAAALMAAPDSEPGYRALIPGDLRFEDRVAARIVNRIPLYRPGRAAARIGCPILFCVCDTDTLAPASTTIEYAAKAPQGEVRRYPIGHFDIYVGDWFERAVADQTGFLRRVLGLGDQSSSS